MKGAWPGGAREPWKKHGKKIEEIARLMGTGGRGGGGGGGGGGGRRVLPENKNPRIKGGGEGAGCEQRAGESERTNRVLWSWGNNKAD